MVLLVSKWHCDGRWVSSVWCQRILVAVDTRLDAQVFFGMCTWWGHEWMKLRASKGGHVSNCIKVALNTHVMCCLCEHSPTRPHKAQETLLVHKCYTKRKRLQEWWNHFATNKPAPMPTNWEIQSSYGFAIINFHRRPQFGVSHPQGMELQKQGTLPLPCALGLMHGCAKKSVDTHTHTHVATLSWNLASCRGI